MPENCVHCESSICVPAMNRVTGAVGADSSPRGDAFSAIRANSLNRRAAVLSPGGDARALLGDLALEDRRLDAVALQELVELGTVAARELGRLGDAAVRELEDAREVVALEALARVLERGHLVHFDLNGLLDE